MEGQLENLMKSHPDTKLIIIDTFQRIRDPNNNSYSYADDYREMEILGHIPAHLLLTYYDALYRLYSEAATPCFLE